MGAALLGIGLRLLSVGGAIKRVFAWVAETPGRQLGALLVISQICIAIALTVVAGQRDRARAELAAIKSEFAATVESYSRAAEAAKRLASLRDQRVASEQAAITRRIVDDYEDRLADARARAERLRQQLAPAGGVRAGADQLPATGTAAGRADEAAGAQGFPADAGVLAELTIEERLVATEQAIQLDALIDWVEAQAAVNVNAGGD